MNRIKKKNWNQIETGSNWPVSIRFGYFRTKIKTQPTGFGLVRFGSISVRFDYFILKTKTYIVFWGFFFVITNRFGFGVARIFY
jgi:hypothetical protein